MTSLRELNGAVFPILTAFTEDGSLDLDATAAYVDKLVQGGAQTLMTTVGTSRFNLLTNDEIKQINARLAATIDGRATFIAASPMTGAFDLQLDFAKHAKATGADAFIAFYPERWYGDEHLKTFFYNLADQAGLPIMIHEMPMRSGLGGVAQYSLDLLDTLIAHPMIVGMKEECMDAGYAYKIHKRLRGRCGIIGAGSMRNFLRDSAAGSQAYLVGVGSFFPQVANTFAALVNAGDVHAARDIMRRYEEPYFDRAVSFGWHIALKETLSIIGLMPAHERAPLARVGAEGRQALETLLRDELGWLDLAYDHVPSVST
ncbi:MAG: dihydrodipicolinate synthase family protein [Pseudomonadota bacterium]